MMMIILPFASLWCLLVVITTPTTLADILYVTENHVAIVNVSDQTSNSSLVQFRVLTEPYGPALKPTNANISCWVENVVKNDGDDGGGDGGRQFHPMVKLPDKLIVPRNLFEVNKIKSDVKNVNMFSLSSKDFLNEKNVGKDTENLRVFMNCSSEDNKLTGQFTIQIILNRNDENKMACKEPKLFQISENVDHVSLGKICCDLKEESLVSSLSTDSDEFDDSDQDSDDVSTSFDSGSNSNSSSQESLTGGLECYLKAQDADNHHTKNDYSSHFNVAFGILSLIRPLDYEQIKQLDLTFECVRGSSSVSVDDAEVEDGIMTTEAVEYVRVCRSRVMVRNIDDIGPWIIRYRNQTLKYLEMQSFFNEQDIKKGELLHSCLSFSDADATDPKAYHVQVTGDRFNIITAVVNHERHIGHLRCVDLLAKRDFDFRHITSGIINFTVKIIDTLFVPSAENNDTNSVEYRIVMSVRGYQTTNVTYPTVELSHTTAPYYRVSSMRYRPLLGTSFSLKLENCIIKNPLMESTLLRSKVFHSKRPLNETNKTKHDGKSSDCKLMNDLFRITPKEGIVYIHNANLLDKIASASLNLLIEKKIDNKKIFDKNREKYSPQLVSNITVNIINSSHPGMKFKNLPSKDISCSWNDNQQSCLKSNGVGTSKGRCTWIMPELKNGTNDVINTNETDEKVQNVVGGRMRSTVYETCTSSASTCPDFNCDELEKMVQTLCPQDCTILDVYGIGNLRQTPFSGIDTVPGNRCWCDKRFQCSCDSANKIKRIIFGTTTTCSGPHCHANQTEFQLEVESNNICGNTCRLTIVSSVAVVFFLISGVLTVIFLLYKNGKFSFKNLLRDGNGDANANGKSSKIARISGTLVENPQYADTEEPLLDGINNTSHLWNKIYFASNFKFSKWEIDRSSLKAESVIGEGEFGKVLRAKVKNVPGYPKEMVVAVKTLKDCASASEYRDLISEFNLLQQVEHANIVKLIGICSSPEGPLYVVVEFCKHGSLKSYLKKFRINWQHQEKCLIDIPILNTQGLPANGEVISLKSITDRNKQKINIPNTSRIEAITPNDSNKKNVNNVFGNYAEGQTSGKECSAPRRHPALLSDCTMNAIKYTTHPYSKSDKIKASVNDTLGIATSCPTLQSQIGLWYRRLSDDEQLNQTDSTEIIVPSLSEDQTNQELVELSNDNMEIEELYETKDEKKHSKCDEESLEFIGERDLLSFCWQITKGMEYLGSMRIVHRDLAARNILVAEGRIAKISDFGLSRDVYEGDAYLKTSKGPLPVKWMAPESLFDHIFTPKSDVWSYGVVMWEIVTMGANPYPGITAENLFTLLKSGYRMEKPVSCSLEIFDVMQSCWQNDPKKRPSFKSLVKQFEKFLSRKSHYLDLSRMVKENNIQLPPPDIVRTMNEMGGNI